MPGKQTDARAHASALTTTNTIAQAAIGAPDVIATTGASSAVPGLDVHSSVGAARAIGKPTANLPSVFGRAAYPSGPLVDAMACASFWPIRSAGARASTTNHELVAGPPRPSLDGGIVLPTLSSSNLTALELDGARRVCTQRAPTMAWLASTRGLCRVIAAATATASRQSPTPFAERSAQGMAGVDFKNYDPKPAEEQEERIHEIVRRCLP